MPDIVRNHIEAAFEQGWSRSKIMRDIEQYLPDFVAASHQLIDELERQHEFWQHAELSLSKFRVS